MLTWVAISKRALRHNLLTFKKIIGPKRLLMPVIKSNAYGHGLVEVAKFCDTNPLVDRLCVVNLEEALILIKAKIKKSLIILGIYETDNKKLAIAIKKNVVFPVYTHEQAIILGRIARRLKKKVSVHVKIDTGASRIGILPDNALTFVRQLRKNRHLIIEGLWSHFSSSENNAKETHRQTKLFEKVVATLEKNHIDIPIKHMAGSASTILYPASHCTAVRFGISLYGLHPDTATTSLVRLKPVLSWKTMVIQVKTIPKGSRISYGGIYIAKRETKLAILPIGYWDGLPRHLSNRADVLIRGKRCPIRGRICMNLTMVDVSDILDIKAGETATIIGRDKKEAITAEELAGSAGTINYEIVSRINPLIPRQFVA